MSADWMTPLSTHGLACRAVLALVIVCRLASPALAQTQGTEAGEPDVASAEKQAARAYAAYLARDYDSAIRFYLDAYAAASDPDILYNIARVYETGLHDRSQAMRFYRVFVNHPGADRERVELASSRLGALEAEELAEATPSTSRPAIAAAAPPTDAASGLAPTTLATEAPLVVPDSHAPGWSAWRTGALVAGGAGLVGVAIGAVFGVEALSDAKTARRECDGNRCFTEQGLSAARSAGQAADVATLSFAVGGLLVATGATLLGIDLRTSHPPGRPAEGQWTAAVTAADVRVGFTKSW